MTRKKVVKGFKGFNSDWTCRDFQYEVGKTYEISRELEICENGFHFCKKLEDCFEFYPCITWNRFAEIEALGEIREEDNKFVTNKIRIVKEIKIEELKNYNSNSSKGVNGSNGVNWSYGVNCSDGVNRSKGVNGSNGVNWSYGVNWSKGVNGSNGVNWSYGVNCSDGVNGSNGVNWSVGVNRSDGVNGSNGVNWSKGVNGSNGVNWSVGVNRSDGVNGSNGVNWSKGVNCSVGVNGSNGVSDSFGVLNSNGVSNGLFVLNKKETYTLFNKEVSKERYKEVKGTLFELLGIWKPSFNNLKSLYLKNGSDWRLTPIPQAKEILKEEAWKGMPIEAIEYLKSLKEFDKEIFKEITGIR